jgi:hypothetical protein
MTASDNPVTFLLYDREGNQIGEYNPTFRRAFWPVGEYVVQPTTMFGITPVNGSINIGPLASEEIEGCEVAANIIIGAQTTQTLGRQLPDISCSASNLDGDVRRYDSYQVTVPPGASWTLEASSASMSMTIYAQLASGGPELAGTGPTFTYVNVGSTPVRLNVDVSSGFADEPTDPSSTGTYTFSVTQGP